MEYGKHSANPELVTCVPEKGILSLLASLHASCSEKMNSNIYLSSHTHLNLWKPVTSILAAVSSKSYVLLYSSLQQLYSLKV